MAGFNSQDTQKPDEHEDYFEQVGTFSNQWGSVTGVYRGVEKDRHGVNYARFNPSIIYTPDNQAVVSSTRTSKLIMPLVVLRPITETLEQWAEGLNLSRDKEKADKPKRKAEAKKS